MHLEKFHNHIIKPKLGFVNLKLNSGLVSPWYGYITENFIVKKFQEFLEKFWEKIDGSIYKTESTISVWPLHLISTAWKFTQLIQFLTTSRSETDQIN